MDKKNINNPTVVILLGSNSLCWVGSKGRLFEVLLHHFQLFLQLVVKVLFLGCLHFALSHFQLHHDDFLNVFILLCFHVFDFGLMRQLQLLHLLLEIGHFPLEHVDLPFLLADGVVVFLEVFFFLILLVSLEGLKWRYSDEGSLLSFPCEGVVDHFYFSVLLFVFLLELCNFILESFVIFLELFVGLLSFFEFFISESYLFLDLNNLYVELLDLLLQWCKFWLISLLLAQQLVFRLLLWRYPSIQLLYFLIQFFDVLIAIAQLLNLLGFYFLDFLAQRLLLLFLLFYFRF